MATPFATLPDLRGHWSKLPVDREDEAVTKLEEAAVEIRGNFPNIDTRIADGSLDPDNAKLVSVRMVKRAMDVATPAGVDSRTGQMGPFVTTESFTNPDGNMYLSKADRRLLSPVNHRQAFTIHPGGVGRR